MSPGVFHDAVQAAVHAGGSLKAFMLAQSWDYLVVGCLVVNVVLFTLLCKYVGSSMDALKSALSDLGVAVTGVQAKVDSLKSQIGSSASQADIDAATAAVKDAVAKLQALTA